MLCWKSLLTMFLGKYMGSNMRCIDYHCTLFFVKALLFFCHRQGKREIFIYHKICPSFGEVFVSLDNIVRLVQNKCLILQRKPI